MAPCDVNISGSRRKGRNPRRLRTLKGRRKLTLPSYFCRGRKKIIINALEVVRIDLKLCKPIHWNFILDVVHALNINSDTAPHCLKFLREVCNLFERHKCKDTKVMSEVFLYTCFLSAYNPNVVDLPWIIVNRDTFLEKHYFSETSFIAISKFFYIPYGGEKSRLDLVWKAARCGDLGLLKLLLKFGLGMMTHEDSFHYCLNTIYKISLYLQLHSSSINRSDVERIQEELDNSSMINELFSDLSSETLNRMCLVFRALEIVFTMQSVPKCEGIFIECYRLLFNSIPEAYVTSVEVKATLEEFLPGTCGTCSKLVSKVTEDFKRLLPEMVEVPQPRSLKHLCRIQVRQCLRRNLNLPHGVVSLPLPAALKEYITLHDDGDYSVIIRRDYGTLYSELLVPLHVPYMKFYHFFENGHEASPVSIMTVPEADDWMISFLRQL